MISPVQERLIQASLAPAAIAAEVNSSVAAKVLDSTKQEGAAVLRLLDNASIAQDPNLGTHLDTTA